MIDLHPADWTIICLYFIIVFGVGIAKPLKHKGLDENYILSGRQLSLPGFIASLVTTWYGGILGIGENTYLYDIQTWSIFGLPYYIFAFLYAHWLTKKIYKKKMISIPDHFRQYFGEISGLISALLLVFLASPAPYILSMGVLFQFLFQINSGLSIFISILLSIVYIWNGGFTAIVRTDKVQFIFMFFGFIILLLFCYGIYGSPIKIYKSLPDLHRDILGGNSLQYLAVWFFIAAWTIIDPSFYQRCAAAKTPKIAKKGLLISIGFWAVFDFLTILTGLYAVQTLQTNNPLLTYPLLAQNILPIGILGFFLAGIFAIIMSTIDSFSLLSAITFGRDILWRIQKPLLNNSSVSMIKRGILVTSFISFLLAYSVPSVVKLFYSLGSTIIPGIILPFLSTLHEKIRPISEKNALIWILTPVFVSLIWLLISLFNGKSLFGIEPFYPGFFLSISLGLYFKQIRNLRDVFS